MDFKSKRSQSAGFSFSKLANVFVVLLFILSSGYLVFNLFLSGASAASATSSKFVVPISPCPTAPPAPTPASPCVLPTGQVLGSVSGVYQDILGDVHTSGNMEVGGNNPRNRLDVNGGMAVGGYAGVNTAPANGMIVSGNVGLGTVTPNNSLDLESGNMFIGGGHQIQFYPGTQPLGSGIQGDYTVIDNGRMVLQSFTAGKNINAEDFSPTFDTNCAFWFCKPVAAIEAYSANNAAMYASGSTGYYGLYAYSGNRTQGADGQGQGSGAVFGFNAVGGNSAFFASVGTDGTGVDTSGRRQEVGPGVQAIVNSLGLTLGPLWGDTPDLMFVPKDISLRAWEIQNKDGNLSFFHSYAYNPTDSRSGPILSLHTDGVHVKGGSGTINDLDLAEFYNSSQAVNKGDLLVFDTTKSSTVKKATTSVASTMLAGVVSSNPAIIIEGDQVHFVNGPYTLDSNKPAVALAGRIPVNVSTENGVIKIGDSITASSISGVGMKATKPGYVVGRALENFDSSKSKPCSNNASYKCGQVMVFTNLSWFDGGVDVLKLSQTVASQQAEINLLRKELDELKTK